jgi:type II secretory pathway pseudopilin PulG
VTSDVKNFLKSRISLRRLSPNDSAPVREPLLEPGISAPEWEPLQKLDEVERPRRNEHLTPNGSSKGEDGFTLLELILVMILSLMILGLVSVYFANFLSSARLQATVREFSATLRQARNLAKINGEQKDVIIDLDTKEYGLEGRQARKIPSNLEFKIIDPSAGEVVSGKYHLLFEPNWGGEGAAFQLSNRKKAFLIRLDPLMGTVVSR